MIIKKIYSKTILSKSKICKYTINPYVGCQHGCTYCYARFMKWFTSHSEEWGEFVDVKINAIQLLEREIKKKQTGRVWISGVCDPYQPIERKYQLTKKCLKILLKYSWPVEIQTKSPLVIRDLELLREFDDVEVGISIPTANESIREIFEPNAPSINKRIETLKTLHSKGVKTFAMIAPLLPKAEGLADQLFKKVDHILVDKMNYHYADWVYKKNNLEYARKNSYFLQKKKELIKAFEKKNIPYTILF
jgi:DNA repair photolyase